MENGTKADLGVKTENKMKASLGIKMESQMETFGQGATGRFMNIIHVILIGLVASSGGSMFGYDIGISGGVTSMSHFLYKFFPNVLAAQGRAKNNYCQYDNQILQLFTSSLYLAGMIATPFAAYTTRYWGRRITMLISGVAFLMGVSFNGAAQNLIMLIVGRIILGVGVGFANQAVPIFLSEIAPAHLRGGFNMTFQLATNLGILVANLVNYGTGPHPSGWRISLGIAGIPALFYTVGSFFLPETPNSLIERGKIDEGKKTLQKLRGSHVQVDEELKEMMVASTKAVATKNSLRMLLERRHRPQLVIAIAVPCFQQLTGINAIMFYAPILFKTLGFTSNASLYSAVIIGGVFVLATIFSMGIVDKWGRKILFYSGGFIMLICQITIGVLLKFEFPLEGNLNKVVSYVVVVLICIYVAAFGWSWGPLGWLVPSEIAPIAIRSTIQSVAVFFNFLFTFVVGQALLSMLCDFQYALFLFFAGWVFIMTVFVVLFLPETKGVHVDGMTKIFAEHWWWRRFVPRSPPLSDMSSV